MPIGKHILSISCPEPAIRQNFPNAFEIRRIETQICCSSVFSDPCHVTRRTRNAVRQRIADEALVLFDEKGFDATTVEDVALAVGISPRSFFQYFPTKEDVVIGDTLFAGMQLRDEVAKQLESEASPWQALSRAFQVGAVGVDSHPTRWLRVMRVVVSAPTLRARSLEKHITWSALLVPLLSKRYSVSSSDDDLQARALVGTAFACLDTALTTWTESPGHTPFRVVLKRAFDTISACGPDRETTTVNA